MQPAQRKQLESLIEGNKELEKIFRVGELLGGQITEEDYEQLKAGRVCLEWLTMPNGRLKCTKWSDEGQLHGYSPEKVKI